MADKIVSEQIVAAGQPWSAVVKKGQRLRIVDIEGGQGVDFLCYAAADPAERYHAANTLKKSNTLRLTTGHTLYSDVARPMMTIVGGIASRARIAPGGPPWRPPSARRADFGFTIRRSSRARRVA